MIRVVVDTPVLVAGFLGPGYSPAHALLEAHAEGEFERVMSPRLFAELEAVLGRLGLAGLAPAGHAVSFCERVARTSLFVDEPYDLPRVTADRNHDLLVAIARTGGARTIVSSELELVRSFVREVSIVTPEEMLAGLDRVEQLLAGAQQLGASPHILHRAEPRK